METLWLAWKIGKFGVLDVGIFFYEPAISSLSSSHSSSSIPSLTASSPSPASPSLSISSSSIISSKRSLLLPLNSSLSSSSSSSSPPFAPFLAPFADRSFRFFSTFSFYLGSTTPGAFIQEFWLALPSLRKLLAQHGEWEASQRAAWETLSDALLGMMFTSVVSCSDLVEFSIDL